MKNPAADRMVRAVCLSRRESKRHLYQTCLTENLDTRGQTLDQPMSVAQQFTPQGQVLDLREYGNGNVNDTFLVTVAGATEPHFILQRLNLRVFPRPELVMGNLATVSAHVSRRLALAPLGAGRRFEVPRVLLTREGRDHVIDSGGSFWRALSFIDAAVTFDTIQDLGHAQEVGYALGRFHSLLSDLPPGRLADTLPGFHVTPGYLRHYDEVLERQGVSQSPEVNYGLQFISDAPGLGARPGGGQGPGQAQAAPDARRPQGQQRHAGPRHRSGRGPGGPGHGQTRPGAL